MGEECIQKSDDGTCATNALFAVGETSVLSGSKSQDCVDSVQVAQKSFERTRSATYIFCHMAVWIPQSQNVHGGPCCQPFRIVIPPG